MSVAKPLPHDAAPLHVRGAARYVDDIPTPTGTLHVAFGCSTVAHGEISHLDLEAVRSAPGVVAVLTALPFAWIGYYPTMAYVGHVPDFWSVFAGGVLWAVGLRLANLWLWRRASRRLEIQGG